MINNENIININIKSYRKLFAYIRQNSCLFDDSIYNNICIDDNLSEEEFEDIISCVNLEGLIKDKGRNYFIGENGNKLSGGQRQKIIMARALARNSDILIMDEATTNMDRDTIQLLSELFEKRLKTKTVICVTHGNEFNDFFDKVVKIENKRVFFYENCSDR